MKPVQTIDNPNCIHTPASCVEWNYGSISYLGVCNGDMLPEIIWEIVNKLQEIAGQDLSSFDIDTLLDICNSKAPIEKNLITILELLRNNQLCLKDYIDALSQQILELSQKQKVNVNLKCLADFDNFGNQLGVTRETLDQIVVDKLCNHETRITTVEGKITSLQNSINGININPVVTEPEFSTCVDPTIKPTSEQVLSVANKVCAIEEYLGDSVDASNARANYTFEDSRYNLISGLLLSGQRENILDDYNNLLLVVKDLEARIIDIQTNCCAPTCDKIKIGFSVVVEDSDIGDYVIRFRPTDGSNLFGFVSTNSKVKFGFYDKITGLAGVTAEVDINISETDWADNIYNFNSFDLSKPITVILTANMVKDGLTCQKCISQTLDLSSGCPVCEIVAGGTKGNNRQLTFTYEF